MIRRAKRGKAESMQGISVACTFPWIASFQTEEGDLLLSNATEIGVEGGKTVVTGSKKEDVTLALLIAERSVHIASLSAKECVVVWRAAKTMNLKRVMREMEHELFVLLKDVEDLKRLTPATTQIHIAK